MKLAMNQQNAKPHWLMTVKTQTGSQNREDSAREGTLLLHNGIFIASGRCTCRHKTFM
jgi:hypothetical protein